MSLETLLITAPIGKSRAREIARNVSARSQLRVVAFTFWFSRTSDRFAIPEVHDMLTDDADWNDAVWDLDTARVPELVRTLAEFIDELREDFIFRVAWAGETSIRSQSVMASELLELVQSRKVLNRVDYLVKYDG